MSTSAVDPPTTRKSAERPRGRPRDPRTDAKIVGAAGELILTRGFDQMTVDDVASRAGVGKATVYRRWATKEDLAVAAMEEVFAAEFPEPDSGSTVQDVRISIGRILEFVNTEKGEAFLRMSVAESIRDPRIAALYRESAERSEEGGRRILERGIDRGDIRPDLPLHLTLQWLSGHLTGLCVSGRMMPGPDQTEQYVDFVMRGIGTR